MKRIAVTGAVLLLAVLSGCIHLPEPWVGDVVVECLEVATLYRPVLSDDDWTVQPGAKVYVHFSTGRDALGNPTGLSDDRRWNLAEVHIQCEEKQVEDSIFYPGDAYGLREKRWSDWYPDTCVWYPAWTGEVEPFSGLAYSPPGSPITDYPHRTCGIEHCQIATITATATTDSVRVRITAPLMASGQYRLDLPGATWQESHVFELFVGKPGDYTVIWESDDGELETWIVEVPADWFWLSGTWEVTVAPEGRRHCTDDLQRTR